MPSRPNLLFVLADQLRAASLPLFGEPNIATPNIDRLAASGVSLTNAVSSHPVCTPYRGMLLTGRHPQTTGLLHNSIRTRHSEISIADSFARAGYRTGWIGKWHLHTGSWPCNWAIDWVPEGRDRLGFQYWRAYNMHMNYFDGHIQLGESDWQFERWEGYETRALNRYAFEFIESAGDEPFCLFLSPHQPHSTAGRYAPDEYYQRLPQDLVLPANVAPAMQAESLTMYRHYLAMTLALDDMVGELLDYLERSGKADNTLVVFTSDHGSQIGAHDLEPWQKRRPYEESIHVPFIARLPGVLEGGVERDALTAPVDLFPSLCALCNVPAPESVEGHDLSAGWRGLADAFEQDAVLTMNFSSEHDRLAEGLAWRGVRSKEFSYAKWLDGREELYLLASDPLQALDLASDPAHAQLLAHARQLLVELQAKRGDRLQECGQYADWYDTQRRVVKNAFGQLSHPEGPPDWSLFADGS